MIRVICSGAHFRFGDKKEKTREPYLLPVPLLEALELPTTVERANTQRPHAENDK